MNRCIAVLLCAIFVLSPFQIFAVEMPQIPEEETPNTPIQRHNRVKITDEPKESKKKNKKKEKETADEPIMVVDQSGDTILVQAPDSIVHLLDAEVLAKDNSMKRDSAAMAEFGKVKIFNPDPTRALWLSALCPGLGQVYNRRYWKLPLVIGGYVGLGYATAWNNRMLNDYTKAYRDAMDNDPNTKSYMDFYPPTVQESDINVDWLKKSLKSKKDYFRRNRDLCIISMVGLYLLCMVDAYVDASLSQFEINDDLSMRLKPAVIQSSTNKLPSVGMQCAISF